MMVLLFEASLPAHGVAAITIEFKGASRVGARQSPAFRLLFELQAKA